MLSPMFRVFPARSDIDAARIEFEERTHLLPPTVVGSYRVSRVGSVVLSALYWCVAFFVLMFAVNPIAEFLDGLLPPNLVVTLVLLVDAAASTWLVHGLAARSHLHQLRGLIQDAEAARPTHMGLGAGGSSVGVPTLPSAPLVSRSPSAARGTRADER